MECVFSSIKQSIGCFKRDCFKTEAFGYSLGYIPFRRRRFVAAVPSPAISFRGHFVAWTLRRLAFRRGDTSSPTISSWGHYVASRFVAGIDRHALRRRSTRMKNEDVHM